MKPSPKSGFTLIEILITLSVVAIAFLPLMQMFSTGLEQAYFSSDLSTARYLAKSHMEKVRNLGFTVAQLKALGDTWDPGLDDQPYKLNDRQWRVLRKVMPDTDPLEIRIQVYQESSPHQKRREYAKPIVEVVTLIEDLDWVEIL